MSHLILSSPDASLDKISFSLPFCLYKLHFHFMTQFWVYFLQETCSDHISLPDRVIERFLIGGELRNLLVQSPHLIAKDPQDQSH